VLRSPIRRLGAPRAPIAYAPTAEMAIRVTAPMIHDTVLKMVAA
jgi:pyruvate dehydrogenase E1 component beta subunit